jgi:hypothetical protein
LQAAIQPTLSPTRAPAACPRKGYKLTGIEFFRLLFLKSTQDEQSPSKTDNWCCSETMLQIE